MIAIAGAPLVTYTVADKLNPLPSGKVTLSYQDGTVLSVQPNGSFERRPAGADGAYEQATQTPHGLVYCPTGTTAYLVPYVTL